MSRRGAWSICVGVFIVSTARSAEPQAPPRAVFNDSHLHLTNYVQRGIRARDVLRMMGDTIPRSTLFGIPLQQEWLDAVTGANAPTYYLHSDAPLYYYSFTDAYIAMEYRGLSPAERQRFDPMITGFNPGDMYAADHIRRVLQTFPGVFEGIGEFTVHKEFVSDKVRPGPASVLDPALDSILSAAADIGLVVILHSDMDVPFASDTAAPAYLEQMKALFRRHPGTTIIWAHTGVGRVVRPVHRHAKVIAALLDDPAFTNLYFDISWDVVAKYFVSSPETVRAAAELINRHPDRFLFGSDAVAPASPGAWFVTYNLYAPLWAALSPEASQQLRIGNYERLFDAARRNVRAWEAAHPER